MLNKLSMARVAVGSLVVGSSPGNPDRPNSPVELRAVQAVSASITPGAVAANEAYTATLSITGLQVGDLLLPIPPAGLEAGLVGEIPVVTTAGTAKMEIYNTTSSSVTGAARTWAFLWVSFYPNDPDALPTYTA